MNEQEMAVKLAEVDARSKSNTHRLDEMDEKVDTLNRLATAVEVMAGALGAGLLYLLTVAA